MWVPNSQQWESSDLTLTVEPYRCDLQVKRDAFGPFFLWDLMSGTSGVLYLIDLTIANHSDGPLSVAFFGKSKHAILAGEFFIPRLERRCAVRLRFGYSIGDTLDFEWWTADRDTASPGLDHQYRTIINSDLSTTKCLFLEGQRLSHAGSRKSTWRWLYDATEWNELDLARRHFPGAVPTEVALEMASNAIVETLLTQPEVLKTADPTVFESLIGAILRERGFTVEFTARGQDGGVDLLAIAGPSSSPTLHLVQCKRFKDKVGIRPVRELYGVRQHLRASKAILVTPSSFTKPAIKFASEHPWEISLLDWEGLLTCLSDFSWDRV